MNFFFDRNLSVHLARMIDAFDRDHAITHQDDDARFSTRTPDIELISTLARDPLRPVLVTADVAMRRNPEERRALSHSGLTIVFFKAGFHQLSFHAQAVKLVTVWPLLAAQCSRCREPTAFEITAKAKKLDTLGPTSRLFAR